MNLPGWSAEMRPWFTQVHVPAQLAVRPKRPLPPWTRTLGPRTRLSDPSVGTIVVRTPGEPSNSIVPQETMYGVAEPWFPMSSRPPSLMWTVPVNDVPLRIVSVLLAVTSPVSVTPSRYPPPPVGMESAPLDTLTDPPAMVPQPLARLSE